MLLGLERACGGVDDGSVLSFDSSSSLIWLLVLTGISLCWFVFVFPSVQFFTASLKVPLIFVDEPLDRRLSQDRERTS